MRKLKFIENTHPYLDGILQLYKDRNVVFIIINIFFLFALGMLIYGVISFIRYKYKKRYLVLVIVSFITMVTFCLGVVFSGALKEGHYEGTIKVKQTSRVVDTISHKKTKDVALVIDPPKNYPYLKAIVMPKKDVDNLEIKAGSKVTVHSRMTYKPIKETAYVYLEKDDIKKVVIK